MQVATVVTHVWSLLGRPGGACSTALQAMLPRCLSWCLGVLVAGPACLQERLTDAEKNFKGKAEMMQQIIIKVRAVPREEVAGVWGGSLCPQQAHETSVPVAFPSGVFVHPITEEVGYTLPAPLFPLSP